MIPTSVEPPGRTLTGAPVRWRRRVGIGIGYGIPLYAYKRLDGVVWDCPRCGREGSLHLDYRFGQGHYFSCRCKRVISRFLATAADSLVAELGRA